MSAHVKTIWKDSIFKKQTQKTRPDIITKGHYGKRLAGSLAKRSVSKFTYGVKKDLRRTPRGKRVVHHGHITGNKPAEAECRRKLGLAVLSRETGLGIRSRPTAEWGGVSEYTRSEAGRWEEAKTFFWKRNLIRGK